MSHWTPEQVMQNETFLRDAMPGALDLIAKSNGVDRALVAEAVALGHEWVQHELAKLLTEGAKEVAAVWNGEK